MEYRALERCRSPGEEKGEKEKDWKGLARTGAARPNPAERGGPEASRSSNCLGERKGGGPVTSGFFASFEPRGKRGRDRQSSVRCCGQYLPLRPLGEKEKGPTLCFSSFRRRQTEGGKGGGNSFFSVRGFCSIRPTGEKGRRQGHRPSRLEPVEPWPIGERGESGGAGSCIDLVS